MITVTMNTIVTMTTTTLLESEDLEYQTELADLIIFHLTTVHTMLIIHLTSMACITTHFITDMLMQIHSDSIEV